LKIGGAVGHNFKEAQPRTLLIRFGYNWPHGFRGDVKNNKVSTYTVKIVYFTDNKVCGFQFTYIFATLFNTFLADLMQTQRDM
jgi:hypothetical protein